MRTKLRRRGLSLLEVLLALGIFLFALVGIGRLIIMGGERAQDVQQISTATQLCQSKLAEVIAGVVPLTSQSEVAFDDDPDWNWSLETEPQSVDGLWKVTVTVSRERPDGTKVEFALNQLVLDPAKRGTLSSSSKSTNGTTSTAGSTGSGG